MTVSGRRVVLVHGLGRTRAMFRTMARALEAAGFEPERWGYPSRRLSAAEGVERLRAHLAALDRPEDPIDFVGFSLGAILIRGALVPKPDRAIGRVVMIGPPNHGAGVLHEPHTGWTPHVLGPAVDDLKIGSDFLRTLPVPDVEIGIVAGTKSFALINPSSWHRLLDSDDAPNDGTIELENTKLDTMRDFVALPVSHTLMASDEEVIRQTIRFLETGAFDHAAQAAGRIGAHGAHDGGE